MHIWHIDLSYYMKKYLITLFNSIKPTRKPIIGIFLLLIITESLGLIVPYFTGNIVDDLSNNTIFHIIAVSFAGLFIIRILSVINQYVQELFEIKYVDFSIGHTVLQNIYAKLKTVPVGQTLLKHSGLKQTVINKGITSITGTVFTLLQGMIPSFLRLIIASIGVFFIHLHLGVGMLVSISIVLLIIYLDIRFLYEKMLKNNVKWDIFEKENSEYLRYGSLIKISGMEESVGSNLLAERFSLIHSTQKLWYKAVFVSRLRDLLWVIASTSTLFLGAYYVHIETITIGQFVMASLWITIVSSGFSSINSQYRQLLRQMPHVHEYQQILDEKPIFLEEGVHLFNSNFKKIFFKAITFAYPSKEILIKNTLENLYLTFESGKTYALVGHSGAGKTTIVQLLLRAFDPDSGTIEIDGVNLKDIDINDYRRNIGYVEQHVELFDKSLKYNILFGVAENKKAEAEKDLDRVAKLARIDQFFNRLENGYETLIGEKGVKLSGGERQRVGIARALIKDPSVLIFDEATSSLDAENEALIHEAMKDALKGRTGIIIAHRLSTVRDADQIIVMDHGKVAGMGTHEELAKDCEPYKRLISRQVVTM